jgi:hypothetical protein
MMPLTGFHVNHAHNDWGGRVLIHCFNGTRLIRVFITSEVIDAYFQYSDLTKNDRKWLIDQNLPFLVPVIISKYERGEVFAYIGTSQQIDLSLDDLKQAEKIDLRR